MSDTAAGTERQGNILEADAFARALPAGARLMGLDLGTKTLGLALSDVTRTIASGLTTLSRSKFSADARQLLELASRHDVGGFVIGLPINLDGSAGPRAQATRAFARNLEQTHAHSHPVAGTSACRRPKPSAPCSRPICRGAAAPRSSTRWRRR